jgi:hypothetical protein
MARALKLLAALTVFVATFPAAAATRSGDGQALIVPRISANQSRPIPGAVQRPRDVVANCCFNQDPGPGAGSPGATSCNSDTSCRTRDGYQCKAFTGITCYSWVNSDGLQRCASC